MPKTHRLRTGKVGLSATVPSLLSTITCTHLIIGLDSLAIYFKITLDMTIIYSNSFPKVLRINHKFQLMKQPMPTFYFPSLSLLKKQGPLHGQWASLQILRVSQSPSSYITKCLSSGKLNEYHWLGRLLFSVTSETSASP